jgi:nitroimidazol reductase NimA-like FMN-containing flavoprotein (pyridoxamine 5'-phosphate oxidase superfamily)
MSAFTYVDALTEEVCRFLLAEEDVGRIGFVDDDGYPVVLPVNYVLADDFIVFRTAQGSKLEGVPLRQVAFEVDHLSIIYRSGWSVLVQGRGQEITTALDPRHARLRDHSVEPWVPGAKDHWLAIKIERVSGRRIVRAGTGGE